MSVSGWSVTKFRVGGAMNKCRIGILAVLLWLVATAADAEVPGVTAERILFGQSAALGGPAANLGTEMRRGILAAFEEANRAGGVGGRPLELRAYDDRYEPELPVANTPKLIPDDRALARNGPGRNPALAARQPNTPP